MILMRILPGVLKELVKHVPTVLFETVEWSDLASELPKLSRRLLKKEGFKELFAAQEKFLRPHDIVLTEENITNIPAENDQWMACKILELFWLQLFSPHGIFLDLKTAHFATQKPILKWSPNSFWTKLSDDFKSGLINVYDGFYQNNESLYEIGLTEIGLISPSWSPEDKKKLGELFKAQFTSSPQEKMTFNLEEFRNSMMKTTEFLLQKKVKIRKDFLYLGIYLVNLYSTLESTGESLSVGESYLRVRAKFPSEA